MDRCEWFNGALLADHRRPERESTPPECAATMSVQRRGCAIPSFDAPLPNQLYAIGGRDQQQEPLETVEMFDTWHGRWVSCPGMLQRRAGCGAAPLPSGQLLVAGGYNERGIVKGLLASCEAFVPALQAWTRDCAALRRARWGHGCASLGGLIYAVGGCSIRTGAPLHEDFMETLRDCEVYDPEENTWSPSASLHVARAGARVVPINNRYLAAVGGCDDVFGRAETLASVEIYHPSMMRWVQLNLRLSNPRTTAAVAALDDHRIMVFGGAPSLSSAEVYKVPESVGDDAEEQSAEPCSEGALICSMAEGRMGCQAAVLDLPVPGKPYPVCTRRCIVVVGGENGDEEWDESVRQYNSVLVYDVDSGDMEAGRRFPTDADDTHSNGDLCGPRKSLRSLLMPQRPILV
eukprot:CAMPEP_0179345318 /NCGR_PEP_ID=MMETSP0797-20121207/71979_1 /TAXON_ID=47934 /ORGANISM="Dinophysis acuminata, Strain DAEP01" /LENGTH=404 /DNA_ID=CAMNT_0021059797 /DNA_START=15 /DNA_END=1229 /DNA_ORIENTATION=+